MARAGLLTPAGLLALGGFLALTGCAAAVMATDNGNRVAARTAAVHIGDGIYQVGVDMPPGTYTTVVPADSGGCLWLRTRDLAGAADMVLDSQTADVNTPLVVTVLGSDKGFRTTGCGTWTRTG